MLEVSQRGGVPVFCAAEIERVSTFLLDIGASGDDVTGGGQPCHFHGVAHVVFSCYSPIMGLPFDL